MKRAITSSIWLLILLLALPSSAVLAQDGATTGADPLWSLLSPIIAIATMTERVLEICWDRYERAGTWPNKAGILNKKDKDYVFQKQQRSQWLGTGFAFIIVGITNARFFRILGLDILFSNLMLFSNPTLGGIFEEFTLGTFLDWGLTAGIIGWGGTELVHNIIEALIKGRNLWKETQQVREGEKQLMDTQIFYDYILPQMEAIGIRAETFYQLLGLLRQLNVPFEDLVSAAATNTLDTFFTKIESTEQGAKISTALHNLMEREEITTDMLIQIPNMLALLNPETCSRLMES